ncbi:MAG: protein kinase [Candidatus Aminicenantes bacterium]|nr:protein kinase [Candidatus Aminicenantes bacterium]
MAEFHEIRIPGCKILSELGSGGMAIVYLGIQEKLDRKVAIKVLEPSLLKSKETAARFDREARTAAMLSHSNIVQIFDTGNVGKYHYIVMEYLEESLKDRMKLSPQGKMHPPMALDIVEAIMKALDYAHFRGVFHRDIKPDNIMFKQDSTPVLVDFGISHVLDTSERVTKEGVSLGTSHYMSPEQCKTLLDIDGRSDIYSLGVIFYEMLTGEKPYEAETQFSLFLKHINDPVPQLPPELSRYQPLIDSMMAKERDKRISSGAQFVQLLDRILTGDILPQAQPKESPFPPGEAPSLSQTMKSPPPGQEKETTVVTYKKLAKPEEPFINKFFNKVDKKLRAFNENKLKPFLVKIRPKLISLKQFLKKKLDSFKAYPLKKKLVIGASTVVILVVLLIIISSPGPRGPMTRLEPILNVPVSSISIESLQNPDPQSVMDVSFARDLCDIYIYKGDIESLKKAEILIDKMKRRELTPEDRKLVKKAAKYIDDIKFNF